EVVFLQYFETVLVKVVDMTRIFDIAVDRHVITHQELIPGFLCTPWKFGVPALLVVLVVIDPQLAKYFAGNQNAASGKVANVVTNIALSERCQRFTFVYPAHLAGQPVYLHASTG